MQIIYFNDTDTVHMKLTEKVPVETRELDENIYIDIDDAGDIVSMTIEHAKEKANINNFTFQQVFAASTAA
ncbi:MAG: DUF2283 domain-containing protein [Ignavibacteria bacterium]|nr:DUF2283 domain-containing protein [Ignavibacteria bacterium]